MLVYIINKHGESLMPCKPQEAKNLLKEEKAKDINRTPFTIQLFYGSSGCKSINKERNLVSGMFVSMFFPETIIHANIAKTKAKN